MKKVLKSRIFSFILGGLVFGSISAYATTQIFASQVTYENTTVDQALNELYAKSNKEYTSSDVTYSTKQGNAETEKTTSIQLNKGRYIIFASSAFGWPSTSSTSKDLIATSHNISCTKNCSKSLIYGWYNEPHSTQEYNNRYETIGMQTRAFYVTVIEDGTTVTVTATTNYPDLNTISQAVQIGAVKLV